MPKPTRSRARLFAACGLVLAFHGAGAATATDGVAAGWWTLRGPADALAGRSVAATLSGARGDGELFLATSAGLWRGDELRWRRGADSPAFTPRLVEASPSRPELVLAVTDLLGPTLHPRALTFPPVTTGFVEVSRDGGVTFERCVAEAPLPASGGEWYGENRTIAGVAFDPDAATEVFLATSDGLDWLDVDRCLERQLRDPTSVNAVIAVRGGSGTVLLASTRDDASSSLDVSELRRSADGGASWSLAIPAGPQRARRWALATEPGDPAVAWALAGSSPVDIFQNKDLSLELWRSPRNARSWSRRSELPFRGVPADLAVDETGRLFAVLDGPEGWRLARSQDGGRAWLEVAPIASTDPVRIALGGGRLVWSNGLRIFETSDGGDAWRELEPPRAPDAGRTVVTGEKIVVLEPNPMISPDGGATWAPFEPVFPQGVSVANLADMRQSPTSGTVYATVSGFGLDIEVVVSEDGGSTWTTALAGTPEAGVLAVLQGGATRSEDVLIFARACGGPCHPELGEEPAETAEVLRSEDGGATWAEVSRPFIQLLSGLDAKEIGGTPVVAEIASGFLGFPTRVDRFQLSLDGGVGFSGALPLPELAGALQWVRILDVVGDQVSVLLGTQSGVHRTDDSGATWQRAELHPAAYTTLPPAFDADEDDRLWVATDRAGVFESVDAGRTWRALPGLAAGLVPRTLTFDPATRTLWAATAAGLFARARAPLGECIESATAHCLSGGRFQVEARFVAAGEAGIATTSPITSDTGAFWFFDPENVELIVKVLEGCTLNESWWVFATGLTDVEVELVVTDTATGAERRIVSAAGSAFQPVFDTSAFPCG